MTTETMLLEDVLFFLRQKNDSPTPEAVREWVIRYPQFSKEIGEAAIAWAEMDLQATLHQPCSADEDSLAMTARSAILDALHRAPRRRQASDDASTLMEAAQERGLSASDLGRQMALPQLVVSGVLRGLIMGATIPETFTRMLARALMVETTWVKKRYPSGIAMAYVVPVGILSFMSASPVRPADAEVANLTFQQVIMEVEGMDESQRSFWLEAV